MASEWTVATLAEVSDEISYGYTESAADNKVGPHFLRITDIQNGVVDWKTVPYCPIADADLAKYTLEKGDIVVARTGNSTGENYIFDCDEEAVFASYLIRFRIAKKKADPHFVWYSMRSPSWWSFVNASKTGSAQAGANAKVLGTFELPLPPLAEQRAIANILGVLDDKIELNRRMNETLEGLARAIFQSWFVDFDGVRRNAELKSEGGRVKSETSAPSPFTLPPSQFNSLFPDSFEDSELGKIPKGWSTAPLSELAGPDRNAIAGGPFGSNLTRSDYVEAGVPVIRGTNMNGTTGWFRDCDFVYVSPEKAETLKTNMASPGDVVFTQRGTLGQVALIPIDARHHCYVISQSQMRMTCAAGVPPEFVFLFFRQPSVIDYIVGNATSAGVPHINLSFLREFTVLLPSREVLLAFESAVRPLHRRITMNANESERLAAIRDALLPKLLSGEIRVAEAERLVEKTT